MLITGVPEQLWPERCIGFTPYRVPRPASFDLTGSHRARLGAPWLVLRRQGLVVWARSLSAALRRQWCRVGASYTDIHFQLPILWLLVALAVIAAFVCWANLRVRTYKLPLLAAAVLFGTSFVLAEIMPALVQRVYVKPNELQLETPYIQRNIASTQQAYDLHRVAVEPFPAEQSLTAKTLEANQAIIDNIRLWDWQPLMATYGQMQEIRTYYRFHDVDVDRYWLDGFLSGGHALRAS
jgi:uncharacterized membrane protein (UPF0182 family)